MHIKLLKRLLDEAGFSQGVEMTAAIPLLIFLLMALTMFGQFGYTAITASAAAREGARAAVVGENCEAAAARASIVWDNSERQVSCKCGSACEVVVQLRLRRPFNHMMLTDRIFDADWVTASAVMRRER